MTCSPGSVRVSFCFVALLAIGAAGCGGAVTRNNTTLPPIGEILHFVEQGELFQTYGGELGKKPADAAEALQLFLSSMPTSSQGVRWPDDLILRRKPMSELGMAAEEFDTTIESERYFHFLPKAPRPDIPPFWGVAVSKASGEWRMWTLIPR